MADEVELGEAPSLAALYARALRPGGRSGRGPDDGLPATRVVRRGVEVDLDHVAAYARTCGSRLADELPIPYLHLLGFPLSLHLMSRQEFPFPLLGLVHLHQRIVVHRPVTAAEQVDVAVTATDLRRHAKGWQFDLHATVTARDEVAWTGRSTYLHREPTDDEQATRESRPTDAVDAAALPATARWHVPGDTGRAYAAVSGDRNPIHLTVVTARPLGFDRPIAHGMWTLARALAALEGRLPPTSTTDVSFKTPLPLPSHVELATARRGEDWALAVRARDDGRPHLVGVVTERSD